ncbi:histidine kinase [Azoarcus sp. KH32C]|uniref:histidine kinase n=1 Tax=Azoarcus sp. KH32C TaxID=748247 RepID=UPI0002385DA5|nr:histidine kinase [Azoarcus sp. KH32C]BAL27093.1 putative two-component system, NarL family, nitrate/nitrite sensor histidine kinase [Azoarcus sp. KH32C]
MAVAAGAAMLLLAQPILTAAWTNHAVRFIAGAAELQERASALPPQPHNAAAREWLEESRALLADLPFRIDLPDAVPADAFDNVSSALPLVETATLTVAEALRRHLRVDIAVRMALLIVALGGAGLGVRLRRRGIEQAAREAAGNGHAHAPPPDRWLQLLDRVMSELAGPAPGQQALTKLSQIVQEALGARVCGVCLNEEVRESMQLPPAIHAGELGWAQLEQLRALPVAGRYQMFELLPAGAVQAGPLWEGLAVPLGDGKTRYGHLFVIGRDEPESLSSLLQVVELVGKHLAMAIAHCRRNQEGRRIALIEERTSMARELHDSLAQSLSYMKIQVTRMQKLLQRGARPEEVAGAAEEVREGLNGAYRKLRELLNTFRMQIDAGGLAAALEEALDEYGARSSVAMTLDNRLGACRLDVNEEFHVVQIVREALSNVVRHAGATQATVRLSLLNDGLTAVTVEDDGQGFDPVVDTRNHHGTTIMRERALSLGGALSIERRAEGGCRVTVRFKPTILER